MNFKLLNNDTFSKARTGVINTDHGEIKTPIFMPVGTAGTVKSVQQSDLEDQINAQIILGNTYHLRYAHPINYLGDFSLSFRTRRNTYVLERIFII